MTNVKKVFDLEERTAKFGEDTIEFAQRVPKNVITIPLIDQLIRAGTSVGSNYCEADCAESKKDFEHKLEPISKIPPARVASDFPVSARRGEEGVPRGTPTKPQRGGTGKSPQPAWDMANLARRCVAADSECIEHTFALAPCAARDWPISRAEVFLRWVLGICKKEAKESKHWLRMIAKAVPDLADDARKLWKESNELQLIFIAIVKKSRAHN